VREEIVVLELGKAGSAGAAKGELPVVQQAAVVAVLRAANWREEATAVVDDGQSVSAKGTHRFLTGDRQIAESGSTGGSSPRPTLDAGRSLPLEQAVFLLWLELVINRRNTAAVAGATRAAVIGGSS
jgi:hypothetical protein